MTTRESETYWPEQRNGEQIALLGLVALLLRRRGLMVLTGLVAFLLAIGIGLWSRKYVASASFVPQQSNGGLSTLAGLATQFGINIRGQDAAGSTDYYNALLRSRTILTRVVMTRYATSADTSSPIRQTLLEVYGLGDSSEENQIRAVDKLRRRMDVTQDPGSGMVRFAVSASTSGLAERVARRLIDVIEDFDRNSLQSNARNEGEFLEQRVNAARSELVTAESSLAVFLERNRTYSSSPRLVFEEQRLQRVVDLQNGVYISLSQSYEQTRVNEVRDTPVITIVDSPEGSSERKPKVVVIVAVALLAALVIGPAAAIAKDLLVRHEQRRPADLAEVRALARETLADLSLRRLFQRGGPA